jgi:hypothetical protein
VVAAVAPEEIPLFRPLSDAYFDHPDRLPRRPKDEMLGFGVGEFVVPLTPVALMVVSETLVYLRGELAKSAARHAAGALEAELKALLRRFHTGDRPPESVPALSPQQLAEVRRRVIERARRMGLSEARAGLLGDAVVGSLALPA